MVSGTQENLQNILIQIEWKFEYFFSLQKKRFPIRFSRVSGYFWCLLYLLLNTGIKPKQD